MHEHQAALVGRAIAKAGGLTGNDLRGQDDIAELERLVVSDFSASLGDLNDLVG